MQRIKERITNYVVATHTSHNDFDLDLTFLFAYRLGNWEKISHSLGV